MKCTNCQGEWTPLVNKSLSKCPFCQADILQMLNEQAEVLSTEVILANMLQAYSTDLLQNQQRLSAMISDLFAHDHKTKRLLLLSIRENIPTQLLAIQQKDTAEHNTHILALQHRLAEDAFLKEEVAEQIVSIWSCVMNNEEPDESFQIVWQNGYCGFMNAKNEMITPYKYDEADSFRDGLAMVRLGWKRGFINKQGKEIIPLIYDNYISFSEGLADVEINGKCGYIDKQGKEIIPFIYDHAYSFSEGLAIVSINHEFGYIDKQGKEITPLVYDRAWDFYEGLAAVAINGEWGFINKQGEEIIPLIYDRVCSFSNGLANVIIDGWGALIDKQGNIID